MTHNSKSNVQLLLAASHGLIHVGKTAAWLAIVNVFLKLDCSTAKFRGSVRQLKPGDTVISVFDEESYTLLQVISDYEDVMRFFGLDTIMFSFPRLERDKLFTVVSVDIKKKFSYRFMKHLEFGSIDVIDDSGKLLRISWPEENIISIIGTSILFSDIHHVRVYKKVLPV